MYVVHVVGMKRLRTFQSFPLEEDGEVKQIRALLKSSTPPEECAEALEGGQLFVRRPDLQESWQEAACSLTQLNQYMKKSMIEAASGCWDCQTKGNMSKHASNHGLWVKKEAYALNVLLMNSQSRHTTLCGIRTLPSNQQHAATLGML